MSYDILWAAFARSVAMVPGLICVIDAIDEYEDRNIALPRLLDLTRNFPSIRIVLISRPLFDIASALDTNRFHHHIEAIDVKSDIEVYIADCVEKATKLQKTRLKARDCGKFNKRLGWDVSLVLYTSKLSASDPETLTCKYAGPSLLLDNFTMLPTVREIKKRLSALPSGLHAIYRQILFE